MNRLTKVAVLLVALVAAFSFSQESSPIDSTQHKERVVVYDTVNLSTIISGLAAIGTLKDLITNNLDLVYWLIIIGIVLIIEIAVSSFYIISAIRKLNKQFKKLRKYIKKAFKQQKNDQKKRLDSTKNVTQLLTKEEPETAQVKPEKEETSKNQSEMEAVEVKR